MSKLNLLDLTRDEMVEFFKTIDEKPFRAPQVFKWLHQFVADDVIDIHRHKNELIATAPSILQDLLNTRELGTINIRQYFGSAHMLDTCPLHFQLNLHETLKQESQLEGNQGKEQILDIATPTLHLSLSNPSLLSVRLLTWLKMQRMTNNANEQLKYRQQQQIQQ